MMALATEKENTYMNEKENAIRIKAKLEARTEDILNLMASMNMTAQEAVDALRISDDDRTFFLNGWLKRKKRITSRMIIP